MTSNRIVIVVPAARELPSPFQEVIQAIDQGENPMDWPNSQRHELRFHFALEQLDDFVVLYVRPYSQQMQMAAVAHVPLDARAKSMTMSMLLFARGFVRHPTNTPMGSIDRETLSNNQCRDQYPHDWITRDEVKLCDRCEHVWLSNETIHPRI